MATQNATLRSEIIRPGFFSLIRFDGRFFFERTVLAAGFRLGRRDPPTLSSVLLLLFGLSDAVVMADGGSKRWLESDQS